MNSYSTVATPNQYSNADLVTEHVDLVKRIAHHLAARLPATVDINDLMQSGMVGLLEAAGNFDASRGASFETYAGIRIRGAMLDDIGNQCNRGRDRRAGTGKRSGSAARDQRRRVPQDTC